MYLPDKGQFRATVPGQGPQAIDSCSCSLDVGDGSFQLPGKVCGEETRAGEIASERTEGKCDQMQTRSQISTKNGGNSQ